MSRRALLRRLVETPKYGQLDWVQEKQDELNRLIRKRTKGQAMPKKSPKPQPQQPPDDRPADDTAAQKPPRRRSRATAASARLNTHLHHARETLLYGPDMTGEVPKSVGVYDRGNAVIALVLAGQLTERDARTISRTLGWQISEARLELAAAVRNKTLTPGSNILPAFRRQADVPRGRRR